MEKAATGDGKGGAISNNDTQVRRNGLTGMKMGGIVGHMEGGSRVK
jgi:hypothetical protein